MSLHLLYIEDNLTIRERVSRGLRESGFAVTEICNSKQARHAFENLRFDLVLLDLLLPDGNGIELLKELRRGKNAQLPLIIISALGEDIDERISGLDAGADDYLAKPFSVKELIARIRAVMRNRMPEFIRLNGGKLSLRQPYVFRDDGSQIVLSMKEFYLLRYLAENEGRSITTEEILLRVWRVDPAKSHTTSPQVFISRLRSKLEGLCNIESERGNGYRLCIG